MGEVQEMGGMSAGQLTLVVIFVAFVFTVRWFAWRHITKLKREEYGKAQGQRHSEDVAATGRLSSQDPNLQNIPVRTEQGRAIRSAFLPAVSARRLGS